jgi:hypothetical protein
MCFCNKQSFGATIVDYIITSIIEASLFVLSPEIEDRDEVEVDNWAKNKKTFYICHFKNAYNLFKK